MSSEIEGKFRTAPYDKWKFIAEWCQKRHVSQFDDYWYKRAEDAYHAECHRTGSRATLYYFLRACAMVTNTGATR